MHDLPLSRDKASFLHALATCHSLKMVNDEIIGDPLDVKMFGFTRWTLEEGRVTGTGNIKAKGAVIEQTALVQIVVRPPGSATFRLEDALKGASRVREVYFSDGFFLILYSNSTLISWNWELSVPLILFLLSAE